MKQSNPHKPGRGHGIRHHEEWAAGWHEGDAEVAAMSPERLAVHQHLASKKHSGV
jgi:hypothetical protein